MKLTNPSSLRRRAQQAGLTLIELLVVLVILTGIGGLLVPTINNALSRTHVATCATTFPEVHQMMQRVQLEFGEFGTAFDSGIETGGTTTINGAAATSRGDASTLAAEALNASEAAALAAVGITSVVDHDSGVDDYNVTFNINDGTTRALAAGESLITLTDDQAEGIFLPTGTGIKYVWLGIGRDWSLLSTLAPEPPVHFGDTAGVLPDEVHSRFGAIFQVSDGQVNNDNGTPADPTDDFLENAGLDRAQFMRVSYCIDGDGFETGDNHIEVYWEEISGQ